MPFDAFAKSKNVFKKPFLLFSPLLLFYLILITIFSDSSLVGDEAVYINYVSNILSVFSETPSEFYLGVGPGYPLVILPLVALKLPMITITLLNAFMYYLSIVYVYKALQQVVHSKIALVTSLIWAFFYNSYENFFLILPETFTAFLVSLLVYLVVTAFNPDAGNKKWLLYFAGFIFGYIAITKIIFGYVVLFMLPVAFLLWLSNRKIENYKKSLLLIMLAFFTTIPYLMFTYHQTGKAFYWGATGGNNLYWMSTPFNEEYGSWCADPIHQNDTSLRSHNTFRTEDHLVLKAQNRTIPGANEYLYLNHGKIFDTVLKLRMVEQDMALKKLAVENIKRHPVKFIKNCISNVGRIFFNYPYSYTIQRPGTLLRFPINGLILILLVFSLIPTLLNWRKTLYSIRLLIFIFLLYLGGSILGSAETRMFTVILPILLVWIAYILQNTVKVKLQFETEKD